jgi:hypothetical protein
MNVKLSNNVLVQCPEKGFSFRRVKHCASCEHFRGMSQATVNGEPIESGDVDDYQVICGRPITRRLSEISEG